jgi:hypothetical protein
MKTRKILAIAIIAIMFLATFVGAAKADTNTTTNATTNTTTNTTTDTTELTKTAAEVFKNAKIEVTKEKDVLFYDMKITVTGIKTSEVKTYTKERNTNVFLYVSDKEGIPATEAELEATSYTSGDNKYKLPVSCMLTLRDNNTMDILSTYANEIMAHKGTLYGTLLEEYYDAATKTRVVKALTTTTELTKPASLGYGNRIKFTMFTDNTYMAVNEPSSEKQTKMLMKVAKITDLSKYTTDNKYTRLMEDIGKVSSFAYNSEVEFDRTGSGGTNAINHDLKLSDGTFEVGNYYIVYAKLLGDGKYEEIEDVELYKAVGSSGKVTMLECVTKFDQGQVQQEANAVTTNPTTTTGDNSIATKKIPQTGATPVFMIVLGSVVLVAGIFVVANKKYRDIK